MRPDHVHLLLDVPPKWSPSRVMQAIKGKTSHHLLQDYEGQAKAYQVRQFLRLVERYNLRLEADRW